MKEKPTVPEFAKILTKLRKSRGLTQQQLADKINVSRRVITYYENGETSHLPGHLIKPLSTSLNVPLEELIGIKNIKQQLDPQKAALWRKLKKAEFLSKKDQKALLDHLQALLLKDKIQ